MSELIVDEDYLLRTYFSEFRKGNNAIHVKKYLENGILAYECVCDPMDGFLNGHCILYHSNGNKHIVCDYKNGRKNGQYLKYYDDGKTVKLDTTYHNNIISGKIETYFPNGTVRSVQNFYDKYGNHQLNGTYIRQDANGNRLFKIEFENGIEIFE